MESLTGVPGGKLPVRAYSRSAIDEFLTAAAAERARLEAAIAEDEERTRCARAALGTHRVMVAMLIEAQRELDEIRTRAEAEAATILAGAGRPAVLLDLTQPEPGPVDPASPPLAAVPPAPVMTTASPATDAGTTDYFDFLRGALVDDEPLGPRPE
jgi:hypothetical protein